MAILEAMAHRVNVVATNTAGIPEVVTDSVSGFLVSPGDTEAMAAKVVVLLENEKLRQDMADKGVALVRARFSIDEELRHLEALIEQTRREQPAGVSKCTTSTTAVQR